MRVCVCVLSVAAINSFTSLLLTTQIHVFCARDEGHVPVCAACVCDVTHQYTVRYNVWHCAADGQRARGRNGGKRGEIKRKGKASHTGRYET